jgi:hypothetical protein
MADDRKAEDPAPGGQSMNTYFPNVWWPRRNLGEDAVKASFRAMRDRLAAAGCALDHALPEPPPAVPVNYSSDEERDGYDSSDEEPEYNGPGGWALVGRLGWCLRSDNFLDENAVRRTLANLGRGARAALHDFLLAREAELAADPYLATKSRALRLQFAALGQEWFATLQGSPTLADYLEGEAQAIDLEAVLS